MADPMTSLETSAQGAPSYTHDMFLNAISSGATEAVRQHINQEPGLVTAFGWHRQTALHRACLIGNLSIVQLLLDSGADPNARNNFDETPVHYACKRGLPPVLHCLLTRGGDVTLVDKMGKGAVHHAAEAGSVHSLHLLTTMYPDLTFTCQDSNLHTPLHLAIKAAKLDAFKYLIKKERSKLKCPDKDGNWPIHLSAQEGFGHMTWTQLCILGLSALHVENRYGMSPYKMAHVYDTSRHLELISELKWLHGKADTYSVKQHAYILWYYHLLLPAVLYLLAIVVTRCLPAFHAAVFFPAVIYLVYTVRKSFHRLDHVSRWPQPIQAGSFGAGLVHTILVYLFVIHPHLTQHPFLRVLSYFLIVLIGSLYVKLLTKDPGVATSSSQNEATGKTLTILDVCTSDEWTRFCTDCEIVMAPKTKHCKLCERCMLGMDHHCLFLLRCIARENHALFVWFILLCLLCMSLFIFIVFRYVTLAYPPTLSSTGIFLEMLSVDSWVLTMFLLNCVSIVWGISLLVFQFHLISEGHTQYFRPKWQKGEPLKSHEKLVNALCFLLYRPPYFSLTRGNTFQDDVQVV